MELVIDTNEYYEDFLLYYNKAKKQQELSNLGIVSHDSSGVDDELMHHVELYDVIERKYAGFSQIKNDAFYGWSENHPYWDKMKQGYYTEERKLIATNWSGKQGTFDMAEWLYVFILHAVTGSGINYAKKPSGYHKSLLFHLHECESIEDMVEVVKTYPDTFYTSVGYQFPRFPKPPKDEKGKPLYKRGGDYYLSEYAPVLARDLADFLQKGDRKTLREVGDYMLQWNVDRGLARYKFQYAVVVADIADYYPDRVIRESMFYYGSNAVECISYLATPKKRMKKMDFLDAVMGKIYDDVGALPYNAEDVACDYIRWVENYIRPGHDYDHLDRDLIWNSSNIEDHPYGRQKPMLELGLIDSFNELSNHPSDDYVLSQNEMTVEQYKQRIKGLKDV